MILEFIVGRKITKEHIEFIENIPKNYLEKPKVKEAILRNFIDDKFRRQLFKELGLENDG